jgi:bisphosphoglycerate-dependent phosphoglycerate mutase
MPTARIYIVRHGETEENRQGIIQGHLDSKLNATGLEQSEAVAKALQSIPFDTAWSSDLSRAAQVCVVSVLSLFLVTLPRDGRQQRSSSDTIPASYFIDRRSFESGYVVLYARQS